MISGIGIDIIEVDRILEKVSKDSGFKQKVFASEEIAFCDKKVNKGQHYAARFAVKEAFLKATGQGLQLGLELSQIEVRQDELGKPFIFLHGAMKAYAEKKNWQSIHVSISHIEAAACAVVIIES